MYLVKSSSHQQLIIYFTFVTAMGDMFVQKSKQTADKVNKQLILSKNKQTYDGNFWKRIII